MGYTRGKEILDRNWSVQQRYLLLPKILGIPLGGKDFLYNVFIVPFTAVISCISCIKQEITITNSYNLLVLNLRIHFRIANV